MKAISFKKPLKSPFFITEHLYEVHLGLAFQELFFVMKFVWKDNVRNKPENSTCPAGNLKTNATCPPQL